MRKKNKEKIMLKIGGEEFQWKRLGCEITFQVEWWKPYFLGLLKLDWEKV